MRCVFVDGKELLAGQSQSLAELKTEYKVERERSHCSTLYSYM